MSVVVAGAATTMGGATTTAGAGATIIGAAYATAGAGAVVVVVSLLFELVESEVCANPTATLPNSTATPKDSAAVFNECFTIGLR